MKKITVVLQSPFLDRIPSLKTLLIYLSQKGYNVKVISSRAKRFPISDISGIANVRQVLVKQREHKLEFPTKVKLLFCTLIDLIFTRSQYYIGGDDGGSLILMFVKKFFKFKFVNFLLEYPDISNNEQLHRIEGADFLITHDHWHSNFLEKHCDLSKTKCLYLPNASYTDVYKGKSDYLKNLLGISQSKLVILHSGGLGKWFMCKELAEISSRWSDDKTLVFHTSHHVDSDPYYKSIRSEVGDRENVKFSTNPVPNTELDELVASADIGIALYSVEHLGYRAEYMGLAAGKIGNYLKCGVPVIATRLPSLTYIEEFKCGILVDSLNDIENACNTIRDNYSQYQAAAYKCYMELWHPEPYLEIIEKTLSGQ